MLSSTTFFFTPLYDKICPRIFKSEVNITLHVYWHTLKEHQKDEDPDDPMEEDDSSEDEDDIIEEISYH